jgi:YggT family protein
VIFTTLAPSSLAFKAAHGRRVAPKGRATYCPAALGRPVLITNILFDLIMFALQLLTWAVILVAIVQTLIAFNVLDTRNRFVWSVADFLTRVTDPLLRPIRRRMPLFGGIDFSPLVLLVLLQMVAKPVIIYLYTGIKTGMWPSLF